MIFASFSLAFLIISTGKATGPARNLKPTGRQNKQQLQASGRIDCVLEHAAKLFLTWYRCPRRLLDSRLHSVQEQQSSEDQKRVRFDLGFLKVHIRTVLSRANVVLPQFK